MAAPSPRTRAPTTFDPQRQLALPPSVSCVANAKRQEKHAQWATARKQPHVPAHMAVTAAALPLRHHPYTCKPATKPVVNTSLAGLDMGDSVDGDDWIMQALSSDPSGKDASLLEQDSVVNTMSAHGSVGTGASTNASAGDPTAETVLLDKLRKVLRHSVDPMPVETVRDIFEAPQRSALWFDARFGRLSGSIFGIFHGHGYRSEDAWLTEFLWNPAQSGPLPKVAALEWGTEMEAYALSDYWRFMLHTFGPSLKEAGLPPFVFVETVGFIVDHRKPWRGVSPDGILHTPYWHDLEDAAPAPAAAEPAATAESTATTKQADKSLQHGPAADDAPWPVRPRREVRWRRSLIEIKCPFASRDKGGEDRFYDNQVKPEYYDQIQGIMGQLQLPYCDFIMWTPSGFRVVRFDFNPTYYAALDRDLDRFYFEKMLPAVKARVEGRLEPGQIRPTTWSWGDDNSQSSCASGGQGAAK